MTKKSTTFDPSSVTLSKLDTLRDTIGAITDEDRDAISAWEKTIKKHAMRRTWMQHPVTQEVFAHLTAEVAKLNLRLSTDERMSDEERRSIFKGKAAFLWLMSLFSDAKDDTMLDLLSEEIDRRTEEFAAFNTNLSP